MIKRKQKILIFLVVGAILSVPVWRNLMVTDEADAISRACQNSPECLAAVAAEQEANANAASASSTANAYQRMVNEKNAEILSMQKSIAESKARVQELIREIDAKEAELDNERTFLVEILKNMYLGDEDGDDPIMLLMGSYSLSEITAKETRYESLKQLIADISKEIKADKAKLEDDRAQAEALVAQLEEDERNLEATRAELAANVTKYENDAAAYEAVAEAAKEAQKAAEKAEQEAHPELYRGSSYTGDNTYPWQADCPSRWDDYVTYWDGYKIGGLVCECVSYVGWKAYEWYGLPLAWGNAYSWDDRAWALGYTVDHTPEAGSIGQSDGGVWGHVFWVEDVNWDGSINVTEYNNSYATYLYSGDSHYGDFGSRKIEAGQLWQYNFIHLNS